MPGVRKRFEKHVFLQLQPAGLPGVRLYAVVCQRIPQLFDLSSTRCAIFRTHASAECGYPRVENQLLNAMRYGVRSGLSSVLRTDLFEDVRYVTHNRVTADEQFLGDLRIRFTQCHQFEYFQFSAG